LTKSSSAPQALAESAAWAQTPGWLGPSATQMEPSPQGFAWEQVMAVACGWPLSAGGVPQPNSVSGSRSNRNARIVGLLCGRNVVGYTRETERSGRPSQKKKAGVRTVLVSTWMRRTAALPVWATSPAPMATFCGATVQARAAPSDQLLELANQVVDTPWPM
jgi:hypothetical protein